jgi:zinc protease
LQAIIVVGDIDVKQIEAQVKRMFADLKAPLQPKKRVDYAVQLDGKNKFIALTDPEVTHTSFEVQIRHKELINKTAADFRKSILKSLFSGLFSTRLAEAAKMPDAPFISLQGGYGPLMGGLEALSFSLSPPRGAIEKGFKSAWIEVERIKRYGFSPVELSRMKDQINSQLESALRENDKQNSTALADQYKLYFLKGEAVPGLEVEIPLAKKLLSGVSLDEINELAKLMIKSTDRLITITAPEAERSVLPSEAVINKWVFEVAGSSITPHSEEKIGSSLIVNLPEKGKVVSEKKIDELGLTEWKLSNGAHVVIKPSDFKNDEVLFTALSPGGTSLYNEQEYESAANAAAIVGSSGLGEYDNISLPKLLNGKQVSVQPFIAERLEGLQGGSTLKDFKTAMELIHLYFTAPRQDSAVFKNIIRNATEQLSGLHKDPTTVFMDTVSAVLGNYSARKTGPTLAKLNQIKLDEVTQIYRERFADAADFTFFFTGSFNTDSLRQLVEEYIGSLPSRGESENARDLGIRLPKGKLSKTVQLGKEDKATVKLVLSGDYEYSKENNLLLNALQEILQFRLIERLREAEAGVYAPNVQLSKAKSPVGSYSFTVNFGCAAANVEKLISATLQEISKLRDQGIAAADLEKFKAEQIRQNELLRRNNSFWLNYLATQYSEHEDPKAFLSLDAEIQKLDTGTLQDAAKRFLNGDNFIRFVLLPQAIQ